MKKVIHAGSVLRVIALTLLSQVAIAEPPNISIGSGAYWVAEEFQGNVNVPGATHKQPNEISFFGNGCATYAKIVDGTSSTPGYFYNYAYHWMPYKIDGDVIKFQSGSQTLTIIQESGSKDIVVVAGNGTRIPYRYHEESYIGSVVKDKWSNPSASQNPAERHNKMLKSVAAADKCVFM
ncbi:hypothetical protein [Alcanivorax sp.]|jgi:hypothetical protein|uniref:hypothetical protein n=1 Tax=Alcanivorax sp. TaxID=1872427 RepID=UPI003BAB37DF